MTDVGSAVNRSGSLLSHLFAVPTSERPFTEALFTTFNVDLGFFEDRVLGIVRASGAAVTVLADAAMFDPDPRAVKAAGTSYLVSLASLSAAFHPKVSVLVGPQQAMVAIGSGNITSGGLVRNDETLTVAHGTLRDGSPGLIGQVADWLHSLDGVHMGDLARSSVQRVAVALDRFVASSAPVATPHTLVSTANDAIIDQFPAGHVDELRLYAPFHDPQGAALTALIDRYRPGRVMIAVQPHRTILQPQVLAEVADAGGVEMLWQDAGTDYRHGKLIEAVQGGGVQWSLTGSANLTGAALLRSFASGGNVEVGVVHTAGTSLYPGSGAPLSTQQVPARAISTAPGQGLHQDGAVPLILGATLVEGRLSVEFSRTYPFDVAIQVSAFADLPEQYHEVARLPAGERLWEVAVSDQIRSSSRVRPAWSRDGTTVWGSPRFIDDAQSVQHRMTSVSRAGANADLHWSDLLGDVDLMNDWHRQLTRVMREQRAIPLPRASGGASTSASTGLEPAAGWRTLDDAEAWARYADDAVARLGPTLASHASGRLILPRLGASTPVTGVNEPIWADRFDMDESAFDDEHTAEEQDENTETSSDEAPAARDVTPRQQAAVRQWLVRLTEDMSETPAIDRAAFVRLALIGTFARIWDRGTAPWFDLLAGATRQLDGPDIPAQLRPELAALAAVCLYRLDQGASPDRRAGTGRVYSETATALLPLLKDVDSERVDRILHEMQGASGAVSTEGVLDNVSALLNANPWTEAERLLQRAHPDWSVHLERDGLIIIEGKFANTVRVAAQALVFLPVGHTAAVRVRPTNKPQTTTVVLHGDVLVVHSPVGGGTWKTYRLTPMLSPAAIADGGDAEQRARLDPPAMWRTPSTHAHEAWQAAGLNDSAPLASWEPRARQAST
ncbi:hypothetical protein [Cellulomonas dongxiuzhuiae]|uniref:hypothetical protein n=1 Tax=Cellulomonas dongxiuzhuiae TaxID=2819979 RepID=UPI001AAE67F9|nr:hypothetical protein [Cellulomonas dongxiuzhuiae]MBO3089494.1 hypothetical protein [Cellulomonas dongxiuzhuiae]